ncbi:hypothetical protein ANO11243_058470 [Dothideomycetidae sp. 11243]|nr:hypothetical protein ANO11243_058470 [fungal sp. No.11243]
MGVPFETLLPYAVILGVSIDPEPEENLPLTSPTTDVRRQRCCALETQTHAKRRQERQTFDRPMGSAKYEHHFLVKPYLREETALIMRHNAFLCEFLELTDILVMERDHRLTGYLRGQTDRVRAPPGFAVSSRWKKALHECINKIKSVSAGA